MNQTEELTGTIDKFVFQSTENGFSVCIVQLAKKQTATVCGYMPNITAGQRITARGSWVMHPKFGKQFQATECSAVLPTSIVGIQKYLGSGLIKGIGPKYAEKLVGYFGTEVLEIIDTQPERLKEVPGIGPKRIETIITAWQDQREISRVMVFLQDKGISTAYATKIYKKYGQQSIAILQENPYRLADEIWGIGFKTADEIAQSMGIARDSVKRICSGMLFGIAQETQNGHLYVELEKLKTQTYKLLELSPEEHGSLLTTALHDLYNSDKIKLVTYQEQHFVTRSMFYHTEKQVAHLIQQLIQQKSNLDLDIQAAYHALRVPAHAHDILLNTEQQQAVLACLQHKISVITGGPGTGKTTIIKKLLNLLDDNNVSYKLAAPTGRAAKRITESTSRHAETIHRLLGFDVASYSFVHNQHNALKADFIIIDEASMIDIFLAQAVLKAVAHTSHLVFIGDINQLPSVGAGNFLNDLISSEIVSVTHLKEIFRQAQDSMIVVNAHRVNSGEFPLKPSEGTKKDFFMMSEQDPQTACARITSFVSKKLPAFGITPAKAVVLTPMNRGPIGTHKLNHDLQQVLNPGRTDNQVSHAGSSFKIGDRVMQMRNNYDKSVFNGDMGVIDMINSTDKEVTIIFGGRTITYDFSELDELTLAYAITIHKSQGSEYDAVIIPIFMQHFMLLQRNLLYTAITRAKKLCIVIGQMKAIAITLKNVKGRERITFLKQFLTSDLQCR